MKAIAYIIRKPNRMPSKPLKKKEKKKKWKIILLNKKACLSKTEKKAKIDYKFE